METYEKEADTIIKKSVLHKNDLIPDTYKYKLENTLKNLPEKEMTGQIIENVKIVRNKGRMEIRTVASVAAAVMIICTASALMFRKPSPLRTNSDSVTDVTTSISKFSVTASVQVTSSDMLTSVSTVTDDTTAEETEIKETETEYAVSAEVMIPEDKPSLPEKADIHEPDKDAALPEKPKEKNKKIIKPEVHDTEEILNTTEGKPIAAEKKITTDVKQPKAGENPPHAVPEKPKNSDIDFNDAE